MSPAETPRISAKVMAVVCHRRKSERSCLNQHGIFAGQSSSDKPGRPVIRVTEALDAKIYRFRCLAKADAYLRS